MAVSPDFLAKIKKAVGVSADFYNDDIGDAIEATRLELKRVGVADIVANDESNALVTMAIKINVKSNYAENENEATRLTASFESIKTALTLSSGYMNEVMT